MPITAVTTYSMSVTSVFVRTYRHRDRVTEESVSASTRRCPPSWNDGTTSIRRLRTCCEATSAASAVARWGADVFSESLQSARRPLAYGVLHEGCDYGAPKSARFFI